jgi:hypothetical protein
VLGIEEKGYYSGSFVKMVEDKADINDMHYIGTLCTMASEVSGLATHSK